MCDNVCVWNICTDVKLLNLLSSRIFRTWYSTAGGGCMVWQSSTNEDTAFPWWYDKGTPLSRTCKFSDIARGQAKNPNYDFFITPRLPQSVFFHQNHFTVLLHQNIPQSKDVESRFVIFCLHDRRHHRRRLSFIYYLNFADTSPMILLLVYSYFLMSILDPKNILKCFCYS